MFALRLESFGDNIAVVSDDGASVSYRQLAKLSDDCLNTASLPKRTLLAIECTNSLQSLAAYLGALRSGHPVLMVDSQLSHDLRHRLYSHYRVSHVFGQSGFWNPTENSSPQLHPDLSLLLSTSGSTGSPKLVKLTNKNLEENSRSISRYLALTQLDRPITSLPIHYSYGLSVINSHLSIGATLLVTGEPVTAKLFWDFFCAGEATSIAGVPMTYVMLKKMRFERINIPSLRTLTQAGGRLPAEIVRWLSEISTERGYRFFVMYGQTEATARISYVPPDRLPEKAESIGLAIPGGKLDLIDDFGDEIHEPGMTGELRYSGDNVMMGYASEAGDLILPDVMKGVLMTGDLAHRDEDGFYYIDGRKKRFLKIFGNRISLDEVEAYLNTSGLSVAVTGIDDQLLIAVHDTNSFDIKNIADKISSYYRIHRSAIKILTVKDIPLSSAGKIQYAELLKIMLADKEQ